MDDQHANHGPSYLPYPAAEQAPGFFPLRLNLYPGGGSIELTRPEMIVGRHSKTDVRLHLPDVSRRHCRFAFSDGRWQVFDLQSMNGLYVNDSQVENALLQHNDLVRIGSYTFQVDLAQGQDDTSALPQRKAS